MKQPTLKMIGAPSSLTTGDGLVLADGTIWSHAATLGTRTKGDQFTIGADQVSNAVKVFTSGYPQKIPVDYEHGSTTSDPEIRKLRAQGGVPKAGDVCELKAVLSADDFTAELKAAAEKLAAAANPPRKLDDVRNLGLWMRWKPTARALAAIKAGEYTELSIAFDEDIPNNIDEAGQGFGLWAVALLNRPFLDDMLPVAASRDTDPPPAPKPASREGSMKHLGLITALAAIAGATVTTEDEAGVELPKLLPKFRADREFANVVATELGNETDPAKAVKVIRELRAENEKFKADAKAATKAGAAATAEATIKEYEAAIGSKPLRDMLLGQLTGELEAGTKLDETKTLATLKSMPKAKGLGQNAGADVGANAGEGEKFVARTKELMATAEFVEMQKVSGFSTAWREAGQRAEKELAAK